MPDTGTCYFPFEDQTSKSQKDLTVRSLPGRLEAASRLEAIATRVEAIASRLEAIATRVEAIAIFQGDWGCQALWSLSVPPLPPTHAVGLQAEVEPQNGLQQWSVVFKNSHLHGCMGWK